MPAGCAAAVTYLMMDEKIFVLAVWGTVAALGGGSYVYGRFSSMPLCLVPPIPALIPFLWLAIAVPREDWEPSMLIVGGYLHMAAIVSGVATYAAAQTGRSARRRFEERKKIQATYA